MAQNNGFTSNSNRSSVTSLVQSKIRNEKTKGNLLWQNLLFVKRTVEAGTLNRKQKDLQEQKFELIHTEVTYNLRLELLRKHFYENTQLRDELLTEREYKDLFSNISEVKACSDSFLADLEQIWQENIFLKGIFDVLLKHCFKFSPLKRYCKDQAVSIKLFISKNAENSPFNTVMQQRSELILDECQLNLSDMLGLPRVRLTSMIMAVERALKIMSPEDDEYESCRHALSALKQLTMECDEAIQISDDIEMLLELGNSLCFPDDMPVFPLPQTGRSLLMEGLLTYHEHLILPEKRKSHALLKVMLFNDVVFLLEPTSRNCYGSVKVKDYCGINSADMISLNLESSAADGVHAILLRMKENSKKQMVDMIVSCKDKATRDKWVSFFAPPPLPVQPPPKATPPRPPIPSNPPTTSRPPLPTGPPATLSKEEINSTGISRSCDNGINVTNPVKDRLPVSNKINKLKITPQHSDLVQPEIDLAAQLSQELLSPVKEAGHCHDVKEATLLYAHQDVYQGSGTISENEKRTQRLTELMKLNSQLVFSKGIKTIPLLSSDRWLVKSGELTQYPQESRGASGASFRARPSKCELFLFNDILLISKLKKGGHYKVTNYCKRNLVNISKAPAPTQARARIGGQVKCILLISFIENYDGKLEDLVFYCKDSSETDAWVGLFDPPKSSVPGEVIYEVWDCPLVQVVHAYEALKPEEMSVKVNDTINVLRKCSRGWYEGERVSDHQKGIFPASVVVELPSEHARVKSLRKAFNRINDQV